MSWKVTDRLDPGVGESLVKKFQAIANDQNADYSHLELVAAASRLIGWVVLNIDCGRCRKKTKEAAVTGMKLLFRTADEARPPNTLAMCSRCSGNRFLLWHSYTAPGAKPWKI
jgi:hypothetical protein